jgi:hypothetical protein
MAESLEQFLSGLREDRELPEAGEEAICQGVVLPILARLGWDRDNLREVAPQFRVGNGRVDYCLRAGQKRSVFVEVKQASERLEQHDEQLLKYAFQDGVELAVLTNGLLWWLYLPLLKGNWGERRFFAVDIQQQEVSDAAARLRELLSRDAVADGSAVKRATEVHSSREKERRIQETLPHAWQELCKVPHEALITVVADKVEALCGHRPDPRLVQGFLADLCARREVATDVPAPRKAAGKPHQAPSGWQWPKWHRRRPVAYVFRGRRHEAATWKDVLVGLCGELCKMHPREVERLLDVDAGARIRFSKDPRAMLRPVLIPGTGIYATGCEQPIWVRLLCAGALRVFGHSEDEFNVELADGRP